MASTCSVTSVAHVRSDIDHLFEEILVVGSDVAEADQAAPLPDLAKQTAAVDADGETVTCSIPQHLCCHQRVYPVRCVLQARQVMLFPTG